MLQKAAPARLVLFVASTLLNPGVTSRAEVPGVGGIRDLYKTGPVVSFEEQ